MTVNLAMPALLPLPPEALDSLMPMHLCVGAQGHLLHVGPTLRRILGDRASLPFFRAFRVLRPSGLHRIVDLRANPGQQITLAMPGHHGVMLRAQAQPLPGDAVILNCSFGIGVVEAVRRYALTASDFAPTDLAVEMLYLVEAKNAVLDEFRRLSLRLEGARSQAEEQALTDTLTGLRNRRAMDLALSRACEGRLAFGLMHLDLDQFKQVNDTYGHAAGDHLLVEAARALSEEIREGDTVARIGGDEFVILLPGMTSSRGLTRLAERLIARLERPITFEGHECRIGLSIGITASSAYERPDPVQMLHDADLALYEAKHAGRGRACIAPSCIAPACIAPAMATSSPGNPDITALGPASPG